MMRSIEVVYDGQLGNDVLEYLTKDLGVLVEQTKPLVVLTAVPRKDVPAVVGAARMIPGVKHIWVRAARQSVALSTNVAE